MAQEADDSWSANSSEAFAVSLVAASNAEPRTLATFTPKFTYPIFGEDERIFGYQNLKINLRFQASDMRPNVKVTCSKKFKAVGNTEATDIAGTLHHFLPEVAFAKDTDYATAINHVPEDWAPPGELNASFEAKDGKYEIWKANLADPAVQQLIKRIQILALMFIEGGSYILSDKKESSIDRWTMFLLYQKRPSLGDASRAQYHFAGYSTVYTFFPVQLRTPPSSSPAQRPSPPSSLIDDFDFADASFALSKLPCRTRISQFLIIPPFQGKGLGKKLYGTIYKEYLHDEQTVEITVEDPNEAFDDLRDLADLTVLRSVSEFNSLDLNAEVMIPRNGPTPRNIIDVSASESLRRKYKIAPRQFSRVLEMNLMSKLPNTVRPGISTATPAKSVIPKADEHKYKLWQLLVKQRLYRHNKDALIQLEHAERLEKLSETLASVEFEYARLLALHERRNSIPTSGVANGKRKMVLVGGEPPSKRARVEDE